MSKDETGEKEYWQKPHSGWKKGVLSDSRSDSGSQSASKTDASIGVSPRFPFSSSSNRAAIGFALTLSQMFSSSKNVVWLCRESGKSVKTQNTKRAHCDTPPRFQLDFFLHGVVEAVCPLVARILLHNLPRSLRRDPGRRCSNVVNCAKLVRTHKADQRRRGEEHTERSKLNHLTMSSDSPRDKICVTGDRLRYAVCEIQLVLRRRRGQVKEPGARKEGTVRLEGDLRSVWAGRIRLWRQGSERARD
jgi:hypothetical protein